MGKNIVSCVDREFSSFYDTPKQSSSIDQHKRRGQKRGTGAVTERGMLAERPIRKGAAEKANHDNSMQHRATDRKWRLSFQSNSNDQVRVGHSFTTDVLNISEQSSLFNKCQSINGSVELRNGLSSQIEPGDLSVAVGYEGDVLDEVS